VEMKIFYLLLIFISLSVAGFAQEELPSQEKITALKVAFISKELDLTPGEAEKFWPVYNEYSKELKGLKIAAKNEEDIDIIENEEKVINLRKGYKERFTSVLGPQRVNRLFGVDKRFRLLLIKAYKRQQRTGPAANRPQLRRNQ